VKKFLPCFHCMICLHDDRVKLRKKKNNVTDLVIVNYTIDRRNQRVLNRVSVELFVLLVNRMEQAIARVLVISKWERRE
jgi:hypothetical protein